MQMFMDGVDDAMPCFQFIRVASVAIAFLATGVIHSVAATKVEIEDLEVVPNETQIDGSRSAPRLLLDPEENESTDEIGTDDSAAFPEPLYDTRLLPPAVKSTYDKLIDAARTGNMERFDELFARQDEPPLMSFGEPIDGNGPQEQFLALSGDQRGHEAMAILLDVLDMGFVHVEEGTQNEMYIWPWFYRASLDALSPSERVDLFRLVTAADLESMMEFGAYNFFRIGINPDGEWAFFVAGD